MSEEQVEAAVGQLETSDAGPAMRATVAAVSGRVMTQSNGKVTIRLESQDPLMELWGVCRLLTASPKSEAAGNFDGWRLPLKDIDSGELFCAFGTGAEHKCLASFQAPHRGACGRRGGKTRAVGALQEGTFDARGGTHVAFKDGNGAVVRGVIMSLMLYIPPTKGTARAVVCGEEMVIFAFVYVAVRFTWQIVVLHGRLNLVPVLLAHRSCLLAAQTIYEDKNVVVEGFPQATVIDQARLSAVNKANAERLEDVEVSLANMKLWQLACVPAESKQLCEHYGVDPEVAEIGKKKVEEAWSSLFDLFYEDTWSDEGEPVPKQITINKNLVRILKFNETRTPEDEVATEAEELIKKLDWLDYTISPQVKAGIMTIKSAIEDHSRARAERQSQTSGGAERRAPVGANEDEMLKLNVDDFCNQFCIGGKCKPEDLGRMQLARLLGEAGAQKVPVPEMVEEGIGKLWFHFAKIVLNNPNKTPEWFPTPNIKEKFCRFVALLTDEGLPLDKKWTETMVTNAQNEAERLLKERNEKPKNDKPKRKRQAEEGGEDSDDDEAHFLQQPQRKQKSPKAPSSRPALMQAPFAPGLGSDHPGRTQNRTSRESQGGSSAGGRRGGGTGLPTIQCRVSPVARPHAARSVPPNGTEVVHGDEVDPVAYDINLKADRMLSLIDSSKDELVEKIQTLSDRVSAAQTTGSSSVAALENKLQFAKSAIKLLLMGAKSNPADMNISKMAARMMMETRVVGGAEGFTKQELDDLFGKPEQAVQQNETAQP